MKIQKYFVLVLITGSLGVASCKKDKSTVTPATTTPTTGISFATTISPMIQTNCAGCHSSNGTSPALTNHAQISANASAIAGTMVGNPILMPASGALSSAQIASFNTWVSEGKQNN